MITSKPKDKLKTCNQFHRNNDKYRLCNACVKKKAAKILLLTA
jgi:hypothetical protein